MNNSTAENDFLRLAWKELSRKPLLETRVLNVMETDSISPEGETGHYIVMDANDWVITIPVLGDDFLMVKQWRHGEQKISIEFPGGVIEKNESPENGAARELKEETGFSAGRLIKLGSFNPNPALMSNHVHIFAAYDLTNCGKQELDRDEFINVVKMSKQDFFNRLASEEFQHALMGSAAALFLRYESSLK